MRWNCKLSFITALITWFIATVTATTIGCKEPPYEQEKREFQLLESSLKQISVGPESDWLDRVDTVRNLKIQSPKIKEIQKICVDAYDAYAEALALLSETRQSVAALQRQLKHNQTEHVNNRHQSAEIALKKSNTRLETSERLTEACLSRRAKMEKALKNRQ